MRSRNPTPFPRVFPSQAMTLAATTGGVVTLAAHQALAAIFFVGCKFGDAVSQTAQAYLPPCFDPAEDGKPKPEEFDFEKSSDACLRIDGVSQRDPHCPGQAPTYRRASASCATKPASTRIRRERERGRVTTTQWPWTGR